VVLWDKIIQRGENAILDYRSMNTKYYFWDDGNGLRYPDFSFFLFLLPIFSDFPINCPMIRNSESDR
jgi:hypothetical protein